MTIHPLIEGTFTIGRDKIFVPFIEGKDVLEERPTGSLLVEVQPFLVITPNDKIIIDTGLGFNLMNGKLQIHENLLKLNINPNEITKVILSHLHKDHAGGVSYINRFQFRELTFPNATYFVYKPEFDFALAANSLSYIGDELMFLQNQKNVVFYEEENGFLTDEIWHQKSGGHCPHHQVIKISSGNETVFFAGDEASQLKQLKIRYIAKYDFDGKLAADLREQYAKEGKENNWQFLFYHDVKTPFSKL
jgi:glyoxylase-like metal-dependent hydrolase (beta-lactamase superfamily II)